MASKKGSTKAKETAAEETKPSAPAAAAVKPVESKAAEKPATSAKAAKGSDGVGVKKSIGHDDIARRAYEIWQREGGTERENWLKAERELKK